MSAARTSNAPALAATANWVDRGPEFLPDANTTTVALSVQWTPWDSGLTKGMVTQAQAGVQAAQAQLGTAQLAVVSDVTQSYLNLKSAEQRLVTADAEVANARESLRLATGRYQAGIGVFLDVLDAQNALLTAATNLVNTRTGVDQATAALAHAVNADPALAEAGGLTP